MEIRQYNTPLNLTRESTLKICLSSFGTTQYNTNKERKDKVEGVVKKQYRRENNERKYKIGRNKKNLREFEKETREMERQGQSR